MPLRRLCTPSGLAAYGRMPFSPVVLLEAIAGHLYGT